MFGTHAYISFGADISPATEMFSVLSEREELINIILQVEKF
jgi:hypothetical protein